MAHKHQTKGANRRRSAARKQTSVKQRQEQQKFNSLLSSLQAAVRGLKDSTSILLLSPRIFNVKPLIADGTVDPTKLKASEMVVLGKQIIDNYDGLKQQSDALVEETNAFVEQYRKLNVASAKPEQMFDIGQTMLGYHNSCEQWILDFNAKIHAPLLQAMNLLNEALTGNKIDLDDANAVVNALITITKPEEAVNV